MTAILFVCTGNICRSPLAEGLLRARAVEQGVELEVDSAGTHDYHLGAAPDRRACAVARAHGIDIAGLRARQVEAADWERFDHVWVADQLNLKALQQRFGARAAAARRLLEVARLGPAFDVPDPYYGDREDFERVFVLLDRAVQRLLQELAKPA